MSGPKYRADDGKSYINPHREGELYTGVTTLVGDAFPPFLNRWVALVTAQYAIEQRDAWAHLDNDSAVDIIKRAHERIRNNAGDAGTDLHSVMEALVVGDEPSQYDLSAEWLPTARAWVAEWKPRPLLLEHTGYNYAHGYAGTFDFIGYLDSAPELGLVMADWKSGKYLGTKEAMQQILYGAFDELIDPRTDSLIPMPKVDTLLLVRLRPDGATTIPVRRPDDADELIGHVVATARLAKSGTKALLGGAMSLGVQADPTGIIRTASVCGRCDKPVFYARREGAGIAMLAFDPTPAEPIDVGPFYAITPEGTYLEDDGTLQGGRRFVAHECSRVNNPGQGLEPGEYVVTGTRAAPGVDPASLPAVGSTVTVPEPDVVSAVDALLEPVAPEPAAPVAKKARAPRKSAAAKAAESAATGRPAEMATDPAEAGTRRAREEMERAQAERDADERQTILADNLKARISALEQTTIPVLLSNWPATLPTFADVRTGKSVHTMAHLEQIKELVDWVEREMQAPFADPPVEHTTGEVKADVERVASLRSALVSIETAFAFEVDKPDLTGSYTIAVLERYAADAVDKVLVHLEMEDEGSFNVLWDYATSNLRVEDHLRGYVHMLHKLTQRGTLWVMQSESDGTPRILDKTTGLTYTANTE